MIESPDDAYLEISSRTVDGDPGVDTTVVTLDRPDTRNALPMDTIASLTALVAGVERADGDALVIAATGDDFSLGTDVADLDPETLDDPADLARVVQDLVAALRHCPLPVVARVQGRAMGAGFHLCLGADFVVAATDATFQMPEVDLGIPVAGFVSTLLPRLVGERRARAWVFTGSAVSAQDAAAAGFVTTTADRAALDDVLDDQLRALAGSSTAAISALKSSMAPIAHTETDSIRAREHAAMRAAYRDGDAAARIAEIL